MNFLRYELKLLWRQPATRWLAAAFLLLMTLATWQSQRQVEQTQAHLAELRRTEAQQRADLVTQLLAIELSPSLAPAEQNPQIPYETGGRLAVQHVGKAPAPLAALSRGHSAFFAPAYPVSVGNAQLFAPLMSDDNLSHPNQHLFARLDPAFVLIWLLPFWVMAMTYGLLSAEREQGTLPLLRAQPLSQGKWLLGKLLIRFGLIAGLACAFVLVAGLLAGVPVFSQPLETLKVLGLVAGYALFWGVLALGINLLGKSSAFNAGALFAAWVGLVLVLPALLNLAAERQFPLPSRLELVHEMRETELDLSLRIEQAMSSFYLAHPELAPDDEQQKMPYWQYQLALKKRKSAEASRPLVEAYYAQQAARTQWLAQWRWVSPAIFLQDELDRVAGTSHADYLAFLQRVDAANAEWREIFFRKIFKDAYMTAAEVAALPRWSQGDEAFTSPPHLTAQ